MNFLTFPGLKFNLFSLQFGYLKQYVIAPCRGLIETVCNAKIIFAALQIPSCTPRLAESDRVSEEKAVLVGEGSTL